MIEIEVPSKDYFYRIYSIRFQPNNKPFIKIERIKSSCMYYLLDDELHDWCVLNNIDYSLKRTSTWIIEFGNINDAILFKLTWC
jgi:hypothetical protein